MWSGTWVAPAGFRLKHIEFQRWTDVMETLRSDVSSATKMQIFYDGKCRSCLRYVKILKRMDKSGTLQFADVADRKFEARLFDKPRSEFRCRLLGLTPEGTWFAGAALVRQLLSDLGMKPLAVLCGFPPFAAILAVWTKTSVWARGVSNSASSGLDSSRQTRTGVPA